jgi:hypothetical protein
MQSIINIGVFGGDSNLLIQSLSCNEQQNHYLTDGLEFGISVPSDFKLNFENVIDLDKLSNFDIVIVTDHNNDIKKMENIRYIYIDDNVVNLKVIVAYRLLVNNLKYFIDICQGYHYTVWTELFGVRLHKYPDVTDVDYKIIYETKISEIDKDRLIDTINSSGFNVIINMLKDTITDDFVTNLNLEKLKRVQHDLSVMIYNNDYDAYDLYAKLDATIILEEAKHYNENNVSNQIKDLISEMKNQVLFVIQKMIAINSLKSQDDYYIFKNILQDAIKKYINFNDIVVDYSKKIVDYITDELLQTKAWEQTKKILADLKHMGCVDSIDVIIDAFLSRAKLSEVNSIIMTYENLSGKSGFPKYLSYLINLAENKDIDIHRMATEFMCESMKYNNCVLKELHKLYDFHKNYTKLNFNFSIDDDDSVVKFVNYIKDGGYNEIPKDIKQYANDRCNEIYSNSKEDETSSKYSKKSTTKKNKKTTPKLDG